MTPEQQKARELVEKFLDHQPKQMDELVTEKGMRYRAKQCALIACNEVLSYLKAPNNSNSFKYWQSVKKSITEL